VNYANTVYKQQLHGVYSIYQFVLSIKIYICFCLSVGSGFVSAMESNKLDDKLGKLASNFPFLGDDGS
jgi:hypothetical protein